MYVYICISMYMCISLFTCLFLYTSVFIHILICLVKSTYVCTYVYIHIHMLHSMCIHIYIYTFMHTRIYSTPYPKQTRQNSVTYIACLNQAAFRCSFAERARKWHLQVAQVLATDGTRQILGPGAFKEEGQSALNCLASSECFDILKLCCSPRHVCCRRGQQLIDEYIAPMGAALWSCSMDAPQLRLSAFPTASNDCLQYFHTARCTSIKGLRVRFALSCTVYWRADWWSWLTSSEMRSLPDLGDPAYRGVHRFPRLHRAGLPGYLDDGLAMLVGS